ncbi:sensor histidine kinase [Herbidospora cretacea]|uniref:sensor histidine kinase n=1 Tax=Herbidospora cretacea TaxID=28444 RepID=UPI000691960C|nr:histidine kinase [Herbidospora cretacea]
MRETIDRWRERWHSLDPGQRDRIVDLALATTVLVYTLPQALVDPYDSSIVVPIWAATASAVVASLTMLVRRRWAGPSLVFSLVCYLFTAQSIPVSIAAYSMTAHRTVRWWQAVAAVLTVGFAIGYHYQPNMSPNVGIDAVRAITTVYVAAVVGTWVRGYRDMIQTLTDDVHIREENAAARERRRIAAELHDTVTHAVTVMVLKAGMIQEDTDQEDNPELARDIEDQGVRALTELRELLTVLRAEDLPDSAQGIDAIPRLVADSNTTGQRVDLDFPVDGTRLSRSVEHAAYRVVQEGLNNARKHAPGAAVTVRGRISGGQLVIVVHNAAGPPRGRVFGESGYGLAGLRERVMLVGGTLQAGASAGGFTLTARIPVDQAAPEPS